MSVIDKFLDVMKLGGDDGEEKLLSTKERRGL